MWWRSGCVSGWALLTQLWNLGAGAPPPRCKMRAGLQETWSRVPLCFPLCRGPAASSAWHDQPQSSCPLTVIGKVQVRVLRGTDIKEQRLKRNQIIRLSSFPPLYKGAASSTRLRG